MRSLSSLFGCVSASLKMRKVPVQRTVGHQVRVRRKSKVVATQRARGAGKVMRVPTPTEEEQVCCRLGRRER